MILFASSFLITLGYHPIRTAALSSLSRLAFLDQDSKSSVELVYGVFFLLYGL